MENNVKRLQSLADRAAARADVAIVTGHPNARRLQIKAADLRAAADRAAADRAAEAGLHITRTVDGGGWEHIRYWDGPTEIDRAEYDRRTAAAEERYEEIQAAREDLEEIKQAAAARPQPSEPRPDALDRARRLAIAGKLATAQQQYANMHSALTWHAADKAAAKMRIDALIGTLTDMRALL